MNPEILSRLDSLAAKLGVAAKYIYAAYVRQARIDALQDAIGALLLLAIVHASYRGIQWTIEQRDGRGLEIPIALAGIMALVAAIALLCQIPTSLFNPDYWAIHKILGELRGAE